MKRRYDITFIGHACYDEITSPAGETSVRPGSAVLCGAMVSARVHARTAVITKMNPRDDGIVAPLRDLGADLYVIPTEITTFARVVHPSHDVDERRLYVMRDPGPFTIEDVPAGLETDLIHLAGISNHEFTLDFITDLRAAGYSLSLDMQSFVRVVGPDREIIFSDVEQKAEIVSQLDFVKLDVVEARILTGQSDVAEAVQVVAGWGTREVLVTDQTGVALAVNGEAHHEPFTNCNQSGRTGRGDTTISAYLARRKTHPPTEALRFAAALASIKMETPGPFAGTLADVEARMEEM
jgi:sugar/nucleoside kinase (ribokinase family)